MENALVSAQYKIKENLVSGRYSDRSMLHLTLAFIGEFSDPELVLEAMRQVHFKPFKLSLNGNVGNFNDILWAGLDDSEELQAVARQIRDAFDEKGIPYDRKPYNPHITIFRKARLNNSTSLSDFEVEPNSMTVEKISLMCTEKIYGRFVYTEKGFLEANKI